MTHRTRVKTVMTPFPYSVAWDDAVGTAVSMMEEHDIRHLPVTRGDEVFGVVSDADLRVSRALRNEEVAQGELQVGLICTRNPYVVDLEVPLLLAAEQMMERQIGSALVTREGKLCGILTSTDLHEVLCKLLHKLEPDPPEDEAG